MLDLLLHPIRMRILQAMIGGRNMTAGQLAELLHDVPHATLYRHLNKLHQGGILIITDQNQVRGATEKVYALSNDLPASTAELLSASRDEHMRYFITFLVGVMEDYRRYLQQDEFDLQTDGVSYRQATVYLTDDELLEMARSMAEPILKAMQHGPGEGRRRRTLTTILIPEPRS